MSNKSNMKPLAGIRVVDFSWVVAGPMATKMLGAMGAEVIKIESNSRPEHKARGSLFRILNNNKLSCTIDIRTERGQEALRHLVGKSDIVVENFSSRVLKNYGLSYEDLCKVRPDLIYVSASGVGRTGPQGPALAYGSLLQAYSGRAGLIGKPNDQIEAMGILPIWTDPVTAFWEGFAILSAVYHRRRTGRGSYIDLSMLESTVGLLPEALMRISTGVGGRGPEGVHDGESAPGGCYRAAGDDAWVAVTVTSDAEWAAMCTVLSRPELTDRYPTSADRLRDKAALDAIVAEWCIDRPADATAAAFRAAGVSAAATRSFEAVMDDETIRTRGTFTTLADGSRTYPLPWRDADSGWRGDITPAPDLGADNDYVLRELLGLDDEDYDALVTTA